MYLVRGGLRGPGDAAARGPAGGGQSAGLLLTEPIRGLADLTALLLAMPALLTAPRGDGHGVLVFPGLLAGDASTVPLRAFLRWLGYDVRGWDLGRNHGPTEAVLAGLPRAVLDHSERTGRPVSLIGWSLGGIYAREMARRHPRQVRQVITLGSPYAMHDPRQTYAYGPYQQFRLLARRRDRKLPSRRAAGPARQRAVHVGLLPLGRRGALAGVRGAGDGAAPERRGPVQPPRLRRGPGDALADRRPAGRPGGPAGPVPAAAGPATPLPAMSAAPWRSRPSPSRHRGRSPRRGERAATSATSTARCTGSNSGKRARPDGTARRSCSCTAWAART